MHLSNLSSRNYLEVKKVQSKATVQSQTGSEGSRDSRISQSSITSFQSYWDKRDDLFLQKIEQTDISCKLQTKAINWLFTTCWVNNFDEQSLYLSIVLFYCYKANRKIRKDQLELILLTILYISSKKCQVKKLTVLEVIEFSHRQYYPIQIIQMEAQILEMVDYNLQFDIILHNLLWDDSLQPQTIYQIMFLIEISMFSTKSYMFDNQKLTQLIDYLNELTALPLHIKIILKNLSIKQIQIVKKKYSSKFEVDKFVQCIVSDNQ